MAKQSFVRVLPVFWAAVVMTAAICYAVSSLAPAPDSDEAITTQRIRAVLAHYEELKKTNNLEAVNYLYGVCRAIGTNDDLGPDVCQIVEFKAEYCRKIEQLLNGNAPEA